MYNILVCDDERDIVSALKIYLETDGYRVFTACNGRQALEKLQNEEIHLLLLDVMMPEEDGISVLAKLRVHYNLPVILLTAKSEDTDKILGLNVGADDYITKPFNPMEVLARVKSQLRRYMKLGASPCSEDGVYELGAIRLNDKSKDVTLDGEPIALTPTEFDILKLLIRHPGEVFSPRDIYQKVWKGDPYGAESTIAVHIRHLREKIEIDPAEPRYLKVVWAKGYKLEKGEP